MLTFVDGPWVLPARPPVTRSNYLSCCTFFRFNGLAIKTKVLKDRGVWCNRSHVIEPARKSSSRKIYHRTWRSYGVDLLNPGRAKSGVENFSVLIRTLFCRLFSPGLSRWGNKTPHTLDVVRTLNMYLKVFAVIRQFNSLFILPKGPRTGQDCRFVSLLPQPMPWRVMFHLFHVKAHCQKC